MSRIALNSAISFWLVTAWLAIAWLAVALLSPAHAAETPAKAQPCARLTIKVEGVISRGGMLRLGLYDRARYPDDKAEPIASADVQARPGETVVTLKGLTPGVYAIQTYQDVNSDDKMDQSWIGLPLEPYGFSRDAHPGLGKPRFDAVKITVAAGDNEQVINLQNTESFFAQR